MKNDLPLGAVLGFVRPSHSKMNWRVPLMSGIGGCLAIVVVVLVCRRFVGSEGAGMLVASMGASAVLLFALPDGPLSGPWPVVGGHVSSAVVGVVCAAGVSDSLLAGALAVGAAIGVMQLLRCVHPLSLIHI
jgi:CBS domain-containing membrane protein